MPAFRALSDGDDMQVGRVQRDAIKGRRCAVACTIRRRATVDFCQVIAHADRNGSRLPFRPGVRIRLERSETHSNSLADGTDLGWHRRFGGMGELEALNGAKSGEDELADHVESVA